MIQEFIQYFTTPCPRHLREMGFLSELIGIQSRYRRCRKEWESHLVESKNFITSCLKQTSGVKKVVVFGSGWLLDVPVDFLDQHSIEVYLVDLIHPRAIHNMVRKKPNFHWVTLDVAGINEPLYKLSKKRDLDGDDLKKELNLLCQKSWSSVTAAVNRLECHYAISVGLLSQLGFLPGEFIQKKFREDDPGQLDAIRVDLKKWMTRMHLNLLNQFSGACFTTDIESLVMDRSNRVVENHSLVDRALLPAPQREWEWLLEPYGEVAKDCSTIRKVGGFVLGGKNS